MSSKWAPAQAPDGRTYYYHTETKQVTWEKPADFDAPATPAEDPDADPSNWGEAKAGDGRTYYYNKKSQKTVWEKPAALQQAQAQHQQPPTGPAFVAGGANGYSNHIPDNRDDRPSHGLPQKPAFDGPRGGAGGPGGMPWEQTSTSRGPNDVVGFRGGMPIKTDEPEYGTPEAAEEAFHKMLKRVGVGAEASWREALALIVRERDYRAIKDARDRRVAFERYCVKVRAEEKEKERERKERLRGEFREMLATHEEIQPWTRWRTARGWLEGEAVFRGMGEDEEEKRRVFEEYIWELRKRRVEEEERRLKMAKEDLTTMLNALIVDPEMAWEDAREKIVQSEGFTDGSGLADLHDKDIFQAYEKHVKALERVANDERQRERSLRVRRERQARDKFLQLLGENLKLGRIQADTKWQDFYPHIAEDERYLGYLGVPGSSPLDLFRDFVVDEEQKLRSKRHRAIDVLHELQFEVTPDTPYEEFAKLIRSHPSTQDSMTEHQLRLVYQHILAKVKPRRDTHDPDYALKQQDAIDSLRHQMRKLDPPIRLDDTYEEVMHRLSTHRSYETADDTSRRIAYDKFRQRLQEKESDSAYSRDHRSRRTDHYDRDHRDSHDRHRVSSRSRRPADPRDSHRRARSSRTPEVDAYQADRLKAQADRERQFRKPSFGLSPPPPPRHERERGGERGEGRRSDRYEGGGRGGDVYDRERRERELERERTYISRADPRDRGKTLDYGDDDAGSAVVASGGSRPASVYKRRGSEGSVGSRSVKRSRRDQRTRSPEAPQGVLKEEPAAVQSGSEEGEIEEI